MASTPVMNPEGACGEGDNSPKSIVTSNIVANDENYALAA